MKKLLATLFVLAALVAAAGVYWSKQPIVPPEGQVIAFTITPGAGVSGAAQQIAAAGVPVNPDLFALYARLSGEGARIKAGSYEIKPGYTPQRLLLQLVRGEFAQEALTIIEGWTFKQMRKAIDAQPSLKHDTSNWTDQQILAKLTTEYTYPEGLFFPDTYLFAKGASDMQVYKQAFTLMSKKLNEAWARRDLSLPYRTPYEALIMASIVEKETGQKSERGMVAGVFINRLRTGMLLQTDPTVIYGMGDRYQGKIHKVDLLTDTPYNTYTRAGLPPTPIALPGAASLAAALNPDKTEALYFVARGDGTSHFSSNLNEHNQAVNRYQR
ncbi:aminodeoxychorismate lyase [Herbaspirillum rubrisubalbicans]|uniref:Endolytic murein transglycosylase n=1 Tax=Herbaspirillum rubrisubalbicans TaxID=80842 RepID=A0ABX9BZ35_9BURK|nr:endolytic transglycosylase MltG [Herbaspirillum rubrisubalbicans]RAM63292.1 aminodeoxychorismate lyase [Herbaspirillum rubrisubalbicans]RAN48491.1 aminodeoxychorismate lyase [Herbaspirillum rubrisubalbicans]